MENGLLNNHINNSTPTKESVEYALYSNPTFTKKDTDVYTSIHNNKLSIIMNDKRILILKEYVGISDELLYDNFSQVDNLMSYLKQYIY
jgi:hypothetical protein